MLSDSIPNPVRGGVSKEKEEPTPKTRLTKFNDRDVIVEKK
jgi:hypothetical protein